MAFEYPSGRPWSSALAAIMVTSAVLAGQVSREVPITCLWLGCCVVVWGWWVVDQLGLGVLVVLDQRAYYSRGVYVCTYRVDDPEEDGPVQAVDDGHANLDAVGHAL